MTMNVAPSDKLDDVTAHINEAFKFSKNWIFSFLSASIVASIFIDEIISSWILSFDLSTAELTVYSPERWLRMKWGTVLLAGLIISIPYASYLIYKFVKPGLYEFERKFILWLISISCLLICILAPYFWYFISPNFIAEFTEITLLEQISPSYDISLIYTIVLGITWSFLITIITLTSQGITGILVDRNNVEFTPIKWRIHMISLFILYLILSGPLSPIWLPLAITIILVTELIHTLVPSKKTTLIQSGYSTLNQDGSIDTVAVLDCSCEGSCPVIPNPPPNVAVIKSESICLNEESNEKLIQILSAKRYTKLIVTGCNGTPIPKKTQDFFDYASINLVGLSWLDKRGFHPEDSESAEHRRMIQINEASNNDFKFDRSNIIPDPGWGRYIPPGYISLPQYGEK